MSLRAGRRTSDLTRVVFDGRVALRRLGLGGSLVGLGLATGSLLGGWAWLLGALVALPGLSTLAAARHPFVAPCPGCGARLGDRVFVGPDEPVIAQGVLDHRCDACGVYLDAVQGVLREVPFGRVHELPVYGATLPAGELGAVDWGRACVVCGEAVSRRLPLGAALRGVLSDEAEPGELGEIPYCAVHGARGARGLVVARGGARVTVEFASYAAYRAFLDANRARVDVALRSVSEG